jgi:hypothetical protein
MCEEDGCCRSFAKGLFIFVNIIFLLAGLLMLALGISLVVAPEKVLQFAATSGADLASVNNTSDGSLMEIVRAVGIFMIILGGVVAIVAFLGFIGACCESQCILVTYAIILIIIVLAEVALIVFAAVYPNTFENTSADLLMKSINLYGADAKVRTDGTIDYSQTNAFAKDWIYLQSTFNCCGSYNYTDYKNSKNWTDTNTQLCQSNPTSPNCPAPVIPMSCCKLADGKSNASMVTDYKDLNSCLKAPKDSPAANPKGCTGTIIGEVKDVLKKYGSIAIGIAAGIVGLELIMITLAFVLCCARRKAKYV